MQKQINVVAATNKLGKTPTYCGDIYSTGCQTCTVVICNKSQTKENPVSWVVTRTISSLQAILSCKQQAFPLNMPHVLEDPAEVV